MFKRQTGMTNRNSLGLFFQVFIERVISELSARSIFPIIFVLGLQFLASGMLAIFRGTLRASSSWG